MNFFYLFQPEYLPDVGSYHACFFIYFFYVPYESKKCHKCFQLAIRGDQDPKITDSKMCSHAMLMCLVMLIEVGTKYKMMGRHVIIYMSCMCSTPYRHKGKLQVCTALDLIMYMLSRYLKILSLLFLLLGVYFQE